MQANGNSLEPKVERKAAALSMIADGNSIASVADVFGVPAHVLIDGAREAPSPASAPAEAIDKSQAMRQRHLAAPATAPAASWEATGLLALTVGMLAFFLWGTVPVVVDSFKGSPPIEQLHRATGWVKTWRDCYSPGRNLQFENVTLVGDKATVTATIPCVLPPGSLSDGTVHRMTVLTAQKRRLGMIVYDVDLDGRTLVAYADVKRAQDDPWRGLAFALPVLAVLLIAVAAAVRRYFARRRAHDQSVGV